ncbi:MAG TPA: DEAD/DEAH box helicase [Gemmatimonadaceae bacterium]|nr:DEAD/DEAH box helicase [Gemmatimonadaceae bacterium]
MSEKKKGGQGPGVRKGGTAKGGTAKGAVAKAGRAKGAKAALAAFHPLVRDWFTSTLGAPSDPQRAGWPAIGRGEHTLILAPTGTGKTLAAFLRELNELIVRGSDAPLANGVHVLYVSPLKALGNDVQRNLEAPLAELQRRFVSADVPFPEIRVGVRTGDTPPRERARMLRKSPHILITTPESLHILLTSTKGRGMFASLRVVIIDEIHALAGGKRGSHLALTLERLETLLGRSPQRIGLSATQRPLDEIARFLGGCEARPIDGDAAPVFRPVTVVDCGLVKSIETSVRSPVPDLGNVGGTIWTSVAPLVLDRIRQARTTLVFVNNRAQAERMAGRVNALAEEELAQPYHGSLSRERRLMLEQRLKAGELRALMTTSSLELGIDIGSVELVIQLQSPKRVAAGLQRVGRAGHTLGAVSRGLFVPTFRDDALEILAISDAMRDGDVEPTKVVQNPLDVLSQVIVAAASVDDWTADDLFAMVRRSYPYHRLPRAAFDETLAMLAGKYPADVAASLDAKLVWDKLTGLVAAGRGSRMAAVISGGTIPDRGLYAVTLPDRTRLGELDEEFVHETRIGDVFQLGSSTWRVGSIEHDRVIVTPAPGSPARMPFWHGEYGARSAHLTERVGALRRALDETRDRAGIDALMARYDADEATIRSMVEYVHQQKAATGLVPDERTLLIEQFRDDTGAVRIVLHAPFGGRVNAPWGMALAQRAREMLGRLSRSPDADEGIDVQVQTTDDGIMLRLPDLKEPAPVAALLGLTPAEAERRVLEEVGTTSLFGARFRMNAARALLLARGNPRRRMPLWLQRLKSLDLLEAVRTFPSFPILVETYRDVLQDAFDMPALHQVLQEIHDGHIAIRSVETEIPSPFAASLQFGFVMDWMYGDDTPRAEQRAAMLSLDRALLQGISGENVPEDSTLAAVEEVLAARRGTAPGRRARTADELAILIDRAGDLTRAEVEARIATAEEGVRGAPLGELLAAGRVIGIPIPTSGDTASGGTEWRLILTETYPRYLAAFGEEAMATVRCGAELGERRAADSVPAMLRHASLTRSAARREVLWRYLTLAGPVSVADIRARYALGERRLGTRLEEWERSKRLLRVSSAGGEPRWVTRPVLEQARRRELAAARRAVEAVELPVLAAFLQRWQHVDERDRLRGPAGAAGAVRQLYGLARPADGWWRDYLPARVEGFSDDDLARLGLTGELVWAGTGTLDEKAGVRTLSGIRFFGRGTGQLWLGGDADPPLGEIARAVRDALAKHGASFFDDIVAATGLRPRQVRDGLRELVAAALVTSDAPDAARDVARWRTMPTAPGRGVAPDPTRWLPEGFTASRPVVQRRANLRRLPKWRRPDLPGARDENAVWQGRWTLLRTPGVLGAPLPEDERAERVARQWLERYGIVSRDWWRREKPAVAWRSVYYELRKLELRGEVRRGYFVRGLAGAQFALPEAVEMLRAAATDPGAPIVVIRASDPANPYSLAADTRRPMHERPRGRDALLVMRGGRVLLASEARGKRISVAPEISDNELSAAGRALVRALQGASPATRDLIVETIDGRPAVTSPRGPAFAAAGFRATPAGLRYYASLG